MEHGLEMKTMEIDALGLSYRDLNQALKEAAAGGVTDVHVSNLNGQRYIGTSLLSTMKVELTGTPGNDLGAFMDGPRITVRGNGQDGIGNTMNSGEIIIHGHAGDALGLAARGGKIMVRDSTGYRAGIHMKEYEGKGPLMVIGGGAQDFLGEYMAGGVLVVLGLKAQPAGRTRARFVGTGMHGGSIYLRGTIESHQVGKEVGIAAPTEEDRVVLENAVQQYCSYFDASCEDILGGDFVKLFPLYLRPYGRLYAY